MTNVKLTHPEATKPIEVAPQHAEAYLSQGWVEVEKKAESGDKPPAK